MLNFKCPVGGENQIGLTSNLLWHHKIASPEKNAVQKFFSSRKPKINTPYYIVMSGEWNTIL